MSPDFDQFDPNFGPNQQIRPMMSLARCCPNLAESGQVATSGHQNWSKSGERLQNVAASCPISARVGQIRPRSIEIGLNSAPHRPNVARTGRSSVTSDHIWCPSVGRSMRQQRPKLDQHQPILVKIGACSAQIGQELANMLCVPTPVHAPRPPTRARNGAPPKRTARPPAARPTRRGAGLRRSGARAAEARRGRPGARAARRHGGGATSRATAGGGGRAERPAVAPRARR